MNILTEQRREIQLHLNKLIREISKIKSLSEAMSQLVILVSKFENLNSSDDNEFR